MSRVFSVNSECCFSMLFVFFQKTALHSLCQRVWSGARSECLWTHSMTTVRTKTFCLIRARLWLWYNKSFYLCQIRLVHFTPISTSLLSALLRTVILSCKTIWYQVIPLSLRYTGLGIAMEWYHCKIIYRGIQFQWDLALVADLLAFWIVGRGNCSFILTLSYWALE